MQFVELFAGIGLFRLGLEQLGPQWRCVLANDFAPKKAQAYALNFSIEHFVPGDIAGLSARAIPAETELITASFPCQDVSLAGNRAGLAGERSGNFYQFQRLLLELDAAQRLPQTVLLENVPGLLTTHGGADIRAVLQALSALGYGLDLLLLDAAHWLPQSRPRLFVVGRLNRGAALELLNAAPTHPARPSQVRRVMGANADLRWSFLNLPALPQRRESTLADLICRAADGWFAQAEHGRELGYVRGASLTRLENARAAAASDGQSRFLAGYRRMRGGQVCLELRADGLAGCLRTATGGSSRQLLLEVMPDGTRIRFMTPREYARLMGVADDFALPGNTRDALNGLGDAVAVPVIRWLGQVLEAGAATPRPVPVPRPVPAA